LNKYRLHATAESAVMDDESGIALYNGCSGRSAFLKTHDKKLATQFISTKLLTTFSSTDIQHWLNIDDEEISRLETWLVDNKFIITQSS
jgi:hypothetical protein